MADNGGAERLTRNHSLWLGTAPVVEALAFVTGIIQSPR